MFQASSAHLQEDTVVYMQHLVLSLSMRVPGGLSVHSLSFILCFSQIAQKTMEMTVISYFVYAL